jgi:hypothetical protein
MGDVAMQELRAAECALAAQVRAVRHAAPVLRANASPVAAPDLPDLTADTA